MPEENEKNLDLSLQEEDRGEIEVMMEQDEIDSDGK